MTLSSADNMPIFFFDSFSEFARSCLEPGKMAVTTLEIDHCGSAGRDDHGHGNVAIEL
jgi:hypothetical protein